MKLFCSVLCYIFQYGRFRMHSESTCNTHFVQKHLHLNVSWISLYHKDAYILNDIVLVVWACCYWADTLLASFRERNILKPPCSLKTEGSSSTDGKRDVMTASLCLITTKLSCLQHLIQCHAFWEYIPTCIYLLFTLTLKWSFFCLKR